MAEPGALAHLEAAGETAAAATLGGLVHGVHGTPGADTMTRYFSTPSAAQVRRVGWSWVWLRLGAALLACRPALCSLPALPSTPDSAHSTLHPPAPPR